MPLPLKSEKHYQLSSSNNFRYVTWLTNGSRNRWVLGFLPGMAQSMVTGFQNKDKVASRNAEMPLFPCSTLGVCSCRCCLVYALLGIKSRWCLVNSNFYQLICIPFASGAYSFSYFSLQLRSSNQLFEHYWCVDLDWYWCWGQHCPSRKWESLYWCWMSCSC